MSGGNLANRLLFENNNTNGVPTLLIIMGSLGPVLLVLYNQHTSFPTKIQH